MTMIAALLLGAAGQAAAPCDPRQFGAVGDGKTLATASIQRAIDACASRGGGVVLLAGGTFLSGTLVLKDNVTLRIAPGATLLASSRIEDFTPYPAEDVPKIAIDGSTQNKGNGPYHLIHADNARAIAIDGGGTIRGNGYGYWDADPDKVYVSRRPRPSPLIEFVASRDIRIENITIRDAPGWTIHPLDSEDIVIRRVGIFNDGHGPNTDAIDVDSSRNVIVADSQIEAGDDCVVLKTTGRRGAPVGPTENVVVTGIRCSSDDQGIKIGTESLGDFRNIRVTDSLIYHAPSIYRSPTAAVSMSMVDGATFENVVVSNIVIRDAATPLFLRLGNRGRGQASPTPGTLRNVVFSNIVATGGSLASSITGLPGHPIRSVTLRNIDIAMKGGGEATAIRVPEAERDYPHAPMFGPLPAHSLYIRHVAGLTLRNVRLRTERPDGRPAIILDDVSGLDADRASARSLPKDQQGKPRDPSRP
ncbi:glycoside hydrolase family 28 protein [Sphingomonas tabacisoli]|uniref:Glycoside hydrolase family 28 protein n=1 Tax=Sphingomonas tabacisoli TaxID=2249466 RepID=A0ABW4I1L5_9SPHN